MERKLIMFSSSRSIQAHSDQFQFIQSLSFSNMDTSGLPIGTWVTGAPPSRIKKALVGSKIGGLLFFSFLSRTRKYLGPPLENLLKTANGDMPNFSGHLIRGIYLTTLVLKLTWPSPKEP